MEGRTEPTRWTNADSHQACCEISDPVSLQKVGERGHKESEISMVLDFSIATWEARKVQSNSLKLQKENDFQPETLYPAELSIMCEGEIKIKNKSLDPQAS